MAAEMMAEPVAPEGQAMRRRAVAGSIAVRSCPEEQVSA